MASHLWLYLWKNCLSKRRHPLGTVCEVLCPVIIALLLVLMFSAIDVTVEPNKEADSWTPTADEFPVSVTLKGLKALNMRIGMAPAGPELSAIIDRLDQMYPEIDVLPAMDQAALASAGVNISAQNWVFPKFSDVVQTFATEEDLEATIRADEYDHDSLTGPPKLYNAITFDSFAPHWSYSVRMNLTDVVDTADLGDPFSRNINHWTRFDYLAADVGGTESRDGRNSWTSRGAGFSSFQAAVTRAIVNSTSSTAQTTLGYAYIATMIRNSDLNKFSQAINYASGGMAALAVGASSRVLQALPQPPKVALFPTPSYTTNPFWAAAADVFAILFVIALLYPVSRLIGGIVSEKESRTKEGMKMMGMTNATITIAWLLTYWLQFAIISLLVTLVTFWNMFENSSAFLIFALFFLFGVSASILCFLISTFFSRAKTSAIIGMLVFFALVFPSFAITSTSTASQAAAACLSAPTAFALALNIVGGLENDGVGITFFTHDVARQHISFQGAMLMMLLDCFIYGVLSWYFTEVLPSEFGVPRPFYFPFTKSYWTGSKPSSLAGPGAATNIVNNATVEAPSPDMLAKERNNQCMKVKGLYKRFNTPDGIKTAVDGLDLTMYEGQIFCLLGHNGAGKTTTISMLTGLLAPSAGSATIFGSDITTSMDELRKNMGVCPQHNVLFDDLTVKEHLEFFAGVKGMAAAEAAPKIKQMIADVGLVEKTNALSSQLSGGQKRKLSVAIALIGDSKLVFLDEPTSGMDPYSRRSTWNVLQNNRAGRIIVLTTHFMDEADLLGDRVAIMAKGKLRCCGSPMFLKSRYGVGYSLVAVKKEGCDADTIQDLVGRHVESSKLLSNVGAEISFQLPFRASSEFPPMLRELEENLDELQLETFGISVTTMEEVFLRVAEHGDDHFLNSKKSSRRLSQRVLGDKAGAEEKVAEEKATSPEDASVSIATMSARTKSQRTAAVNARVARNMCMPHFVALLQKRFRYAMRDRKAMVFQMLIPVVAVLLGMVLLTLSSVTDAPKLTMSSALYNIQTDGSVLANLVPYVNTSAPGDITGQILSHVPSANITLVKVMEDDLFVMYNNTVVYDPASYNPTDPLLLRAFSNYLLETRGDQGPSRHGAFIIQGGMGAGQVLTSALWVNSTAYHAVPLYTNQLNNAIFKITSGSSDATITVSNHPLPHTARIKAVAQSAGALLVAIIVMAAFSFVPASFIVYIVREEFMGAKHQQLISGVSIVAYWTSNFVFDTVAYLLPWGLVMIIIAAFDVDEFVEGDNLSATMGAVFAFGPAAAAFCYFISFAFKSPSAAQNVVLMAGMLSIIMMLASFIMQFIDSVRDTDQTLRWFYRALPGYCLGESLLNLALKALLSAFSGSSTTLDSWDLEVVGEPVLYTFISTLVYLGGAIGMDYLLSFPTIRQKLFRDPVVPEPAATVDEDVAAEAEQVTRDGAAKKNAVVVRGLRKVYRNKKVAVRQMDFGIRNGECFGLLGINGAGKTTTLQVLTGNQVPSQGSAQVFGFDIMQEQLKVRQLLGYCPQFDALLDLLTTREHLEMYARIKGVPTEQRANAVAALLKDMDLTDFENKLASTLSGGNKRKLSVAIAMISEPPIMFLDEPSTGMDPVARRFMWNVIARMAKKAAVVLVSHSMEECEALCNRIGIMVGGRFRCMGSVQHLKQRFGNGFSSEIKLGPASDIGMDALVAKMGGNAEAVVTRDNLAAFCNALGDPTRAAMCAPGGAGWMIDTAIRSDGGVTVKSFAEWWLRETEVAMVHSFVHQTFTGAELVERQGDRLRYKIPSAGQPLSAMFASLEDNKTRLNIVEYSISQTSLEEIFNYFAAQQEEEVGAVRGVVSASSIPAVGQVPTMLASQTAPADN